MLPRHAPAHLPTRKTKYCTRRASVQDRVCREARDIPFLSLSPGARLHGRAKPQPQFTDAGCVWPFSPPSPSKNGGIRRAAVHRLRPRIAPPPRSGSVVCSVVDSSSFPFWLGFDSFGVGFAFDAEEAAAAGGLHRHRGFH